MNATLAVAYPHMCGVGGDLFLLYFDAGRGRVFALNGSGRAPKAATPEMFEQRGLRSVPARGPLSATVPGVIDAWQSAIDRFGRLSLQDVLAPAIDAACTGVEVTERLAAWIAEKGRHLAADPYLRRRFLAEDGAPLPAGSHLRLPELAATLQRIAEHGADDFYHGQLAAELDRAVRQAGGLLTLEDLSEHRSQWVEPVSGELGPYTLYTTPPNSQGFVAIQMLRLLEHWHSGEYALSSADYIHDVVRAKKLAFADRARYLCDPEFGDVPVSRLTSLKHLKDITRHGAATDQGISMLTGDTIYTCAVDGDGNACSLIQSIYYAFGSIFSIGDTGIVLHNRAHYFSLDATSVNCIAGSKRPAHTLMASIAVLDGRVAFVVGAMGADGQPQTVTQVVMRIIADEHPQDAVSAPRFLSGRFLLEDPDDALVIEGGFQETVYNELRRRGHVVEEAAHLDERMGHAHAICVGPCDPLTVGSDPRSDGEGIVVRLPPAAVGSEREP